MAALLEVVETFFRNDEWPLNPLGDESIFQVGFQGDNGQWMCYAQVREEENQFIFYSVSPTRVPEAQRSQMAEFLTRANYGLIIGNFEMDFTDGEVRYKSSMDLTGVTPDPELVRQVVYPNVLMMDRYLPGIMSVLYGDVTPTEAIQRIEG